MTKLANDIAPDVAAKQFLISNPAIFVAHYSGLHLKDFHIQMLDFWAHTQKFVNLVPATHGKTTLMKWYIIWRICHNPNVRIILIMKNEDEAKLFAANIRAELTSNIPLIKDWGPFKPRDRNIPWNNDAMFVAKRQINDVRPTIEFAGSKTIDQVLGHRCDVLLCDDIVTLDSTNTREQSDKQIEKFNLGAQTCPRYMWEVDENGEVIVPDGIYWPKDVVYKQVGLVGTVFRPFDLFHHLAGKISKLQPGIIYEGKDPTYKVLYFDCWRDEKNKIPLWPESMPAKELDLMRDTMGQIDFNKRFRNIAVDEGMLTFKKWEIYGEEHAGVKYPGCLDYTRELGEYSLNRPYLVLGFDPSTSRITRDSSFCTFVLLGIDLDDPKQTRHIIDLWRGQLGFEDIFSMLYFGNEARGIEGFYSKYHYDEVRIEANSFQKWLFEADKTQRAVGAGVSVEPHETNDNKHDPVMGVGSMQNLVRDGLVRIPYADVPSTRIVVEKFLEEVSDFPEGFHDYAMAWWFAELGIRERESKYQAWHSGNIGQVITNPFYRR